VVRRAARLEYVLENIERLVIKPAYPNQNFSVVFGRDLDMVAREKLTKRLIARPHAYVAQERLAFSFRRRCGAAAAGVSRDFRRAHSAFACTPSRPRRGYRVMPGGLARIASDAADIVSMQRGGGSKDVWVLAPDRRSIDESPVPSAAPRAPARHDDFAVAPGGETCSGWAATVSDAEDKSRLLRATLRVRPNALLWPQVLDTCGHFVAPALFDDVNPLGPDRRPAAPGVVRRAGTQPLSTENWRAIGVLQREFQDAALAKRDPRETLDALLLSLAGLAGFALDDMTQDDGWRLMMVGRRLGAPAIPGRTAGATIALRGYAQSERIGVAARHRRQHHHLPHAYLAAPRLGSTIDLLVFDQAEPRALAFQWHAIEYSLVRVAASLGGAPDDTLDEAVTLVEEMQLSSIEGDSARAVRARRGLAEQLSGLSTAAGKLSDRLSLKHSRSSTSGFAR